MRIWRALRGGAPRWTDTPPTCDGEGDTGKGEGEGDEGEGDDVEGEGEGDEGGSEGVGSRKARPVRRARLGRRVVSPEYFVARALCVY